MSKDINGFFPIKILFLGLSNVGKTSLIKRLINREDYKIEILHDYTICLDIYLKAFQTEGQFIKCELWDTPGILGAMLDNMMYIKYVDVIIFVFDLSSKNSFTEMKSYFKQYKDLAKQLKLRNDVIIIGNKLDKINSRQISFEEINDFAMKNEVNFYEMSAKDNKNGYYKLFNCIENIAQNYLIKYKIIIKNNYYDIIKYRYISKRDEKAVKPSLIYKQVDIFVKTLFKLFPVEDYILQIINDINEFYKSNVYKKITIKNFEDLKTNVYNLEILRGKLIDVFKIVALKYNVISQESYQIKKKQVKNEENNENPKSLLESDLSTNELTLVLFIQSNSILRQAIHYSIHDYILNFILDFNNENILEKRLNMIIKEDIEEKELIFKYFCDIENKKQKIIALFNDNYIKYFSSSEMHQYYLFMRFINYLFDHLENLYSEKSISTFFEKGEKALNILTEYIYAIHKQFEKVQNENIKHLSVYELEKQIAYYSKKCLKYFKYVLNKYNSEYMINKDKIIYCVKIRLYLSIVYNLLGKQYESILYFYSSFLLITQFLKNKKELKQNKSVVNNDIIKEEKEVFNLFNKVKDKLFPKINNFSFDYNQKVFKEIKRKIKYHLNNSNQFYLLYNQQNEELKENINSKGGKYISLKNSSKKFFDFFSFPSIILKIYKSLNENIQNDEKLKIKIKLYEIYSDSLIYYKREQYNMFFKCLNQNYCQNDSLLKYDGKNISSLKIEHSKIESILIKYNFLPSDIAQLFNIIGVALMLLFRKNITKEENIKDEQIKSFKKHKELAFMIFNAGLNDNLIKKANDLDLELKNQLNLEKRENNYRFSLEQIRNCIRINISILLLIKDYNKAFEMINIIYNSLYDSNDFPINYPLEKQKEFLNVLYLDKINTIPDTSNNYFDNNIFNIFTNIKDYMPYYKNEKDDIEYVNYFIDINDIIDEFDLINAIMANSNKEAFNKNFENFITPQNFKEKFSEYYNNSTGEEKELFNNILNKENLGNLNFWNKKFDNKQGKGFLFNPIYINYISKYYNFKINLFTINENKKKLDFLKSISLGKKYSLNLICDKNITQIYKIFIPLINKNEILKYESRNKKEYLNNLLNRVEEYKTLYPDFSNLLLWKIINIIKLSLLNETSLNELNEEIIEIYLNSMYKLGMYEQIIHFINENINNLLKNDKKYYLLLYNCYKRLCLYDKSIDAIKKYLYENNSSEKKLNYEVVKKINNLKEKGFIDIYNYYKNLEKERPITFIPPLMDEDLFQILNDKYKNADDNIFNLEAQLFEEKIEINQKAQLQKRLEKIKDGNKFRILCIEGCGIKSLIQLMYLCEIENYLQKPICQIFDCIVTSRDGLFICGLLTTQNEKGEVKYHANDILKIFNMQKETIYNNNLKKDLKLDLLRKLYVMPEIVGNLYYYDEKCHGILKIGINDQIISLFENYIDMNESQIKKESKISLNHILRIIPKNIKKQNIYIINIGNGEYPFNIVKNNSLYEQFFLKQILGDHYLNLDIILNTSKDEGKYSLQSLDNQFTELFSNCIEYFSEIKENNILLYDKLEKFFISKNPQ